MLDWKFRDLFNERFYTAFKEKFGHQIFKILRILILMIVLSYFFTVGIVPTESMYPSLNAKDYVVFERHTDYHRGDIVLFNYPLDERVKYVKRIIGLPGDEVEVKYDLVYVNGEILNEVPYIFGLTFYSYPKTIVPPHSYFVLGDNRNNSEDSHVWGFVPEENLRGKAVVTLLPLKGFTVHRNPFEKLLN